MTGAHTWKRWEVPVGENRWNVPKDHWTAWRGHVLRPGKVKEPRLFVLICCPLCGVAATLPHLIDAKGGVHPSIGCPHKGCKLHTTPNTLEGWDYGDRPDTKDK